VSIVVFWDLDGTLLTTNRGGVAALEDAFEHVLGRRVDLSDLKTAGLTDREIARVIVTDIAGFSDPAAEISFLEHYACALPERLEQKRGSVMPNVLGVLEACATHDRVQVGLLTGNIERCAHAKLMSYGIDPDLFTFGGFAEDGHTRVEIGAAALSRSGGLGAWSNAFLIGDTPSDIEAGQALGLCTIAVATGGFTKEALLSTAAWTVFDHLPEPTAFLTLVGVG
jgi:phosphoglycolate phosphatase-like HAD superfamily hydrolase